MSQIVKLKVNINLEFMENLLNKLGVFFNRLKNGISIAGYSHGYGSITLEEKNGEVEAKYDNMYTSGFNKLMNIYKEEIITERAYKAGFVAVKRTETDKEIILQLRK